MEKRVVKWGIMGPGWISGTFAEELAFAPGAELVAVGGRSLDKAKAFADKYGAVRAYGSCEELAADPEVEIVYVGSLHTVHKQHALTLLGGGKAVLCEKPFTITAEEASEVAAFAREKGLFLMEAMWSRYLPPLRKVREWLAEGLIGEVQHVSAEFGFDAGWNPEGRLLNPALGGGALLDAGIYPISFASMVYGTQPSRIESSVYIGETGVDERFSLLCEYDKGRTATLHAAVRLNLSNEAIIYGTKGTITIPKFLFARSATLHIHGGETIAFEDDRPNGGHSFQAIEAMDRLREGSTESPIMPLDETAAIMGTLDAVRAQWGLKFPWETS